MNPTWLVRAAENDLAIIREGLAERERESERMRELEENVRGTVAAAVIEPGGRQFRDPDMQRKLRRIRRRLEDMEARTKGDESLLSKLEIIHKFGESARERRRGERDVFDKMKREVPRNTLLLGVARQGQFTHEGYIAVRRNCYTHVQLDKKRPVMQCTCEKQGRTSCKEGCMNADTLHECGVGDHTREWLEKNGGTCGNMGFEEDVERPKLRVLRTRDRGAYAEGGGYEA
jgi:hypothetical protein